MTIKQLHDFYYEALIAIDQICHRNHLVYFLHAGTLLGAVREQNFIPWDDDVDLCILREELPRFKAVMKKDLPSNYQFLEPLDFSPYFFDFAHRIVRTDVLLRKETAEDRAYKNLQNCLSIDVFIMDIAPSEPWKQKGAVFLHKIIYGMAMGHRVRLDYECYRGLNRLRVMLLSLIGRCFKLETLLYLHKKLAMHWRHTPSPYRYSPDDIITCIHIIYQTDWFAKSVEGYLRNTSFPLPYGWDALLTITYGDYMTPVKDLSRLHAEIDTASEIHE